MSCSENDRPEATGTPCESAATMERELNELGKDMFTVEVSVGDEPSVVNVLITWHPHF